MHCPEEVQTIVTRILEVGLLRCRAAAWSGDAARCAIEANHLHNLPSLLNEFSAEKLKYYWDTERAGFVEASSDVTISEFYPLWDALRQYATFPISKQ